MENLDIVEVWRERGEWGRGWGGDFNPDCKPDIYDKSTSSYSTTSPRCNFAGGTGWETECSSRYERSEKESMAVNTEVRQIERGGKEPLEGGSPSMTSLCIWRAPV